MPLVGGEEELQVLTECQYIYPVETLSDLQRVRSLFSDLRLYVDFYCFPNKEKKKLVYLAGTVPVHYEGEKYNIPVCIWLHETHPASRPRCYVCPSVSMVINPSCPYVDATGNIRLHALSSWSRGVSNLLLLVSEMKQAFQKDTPLYARSLRQATPPAGVQVSHSAGSLQHPSSSTSVTSSSSSSVTSSIAFPRSQHLAHLSGQKVSQWELSREVGGERSYTEELLGIDFSAPSPSSSNYNPFLSSASDETGVPPADPLSKMMGCLSLTQEGSGPAPGADLVQVRRTTGSDHAPTSVAARLPPDQATIFLSLLTMEGRSFSPDDIMEAVQLSTDFPSALKFLTHCCPLCQDQVPFSKIITMTHCSCFLCQTCFKTFFSAAIKERSVDQLVCPQCGRPEVRGQGGMEEAMDYFNLLDTQIRHFLPPHIHELFQRKLRDRALQEMSNFRWCAHCSFGMLHEADRLRMDCPSCKKSTCSQCRSPWSPQHQGLSCQQFRVWQQKNQLDHHSTLLSYNTIECPNCQFIFSLSKGGCLHFTCSQCQHQFCGGCSQPFTLGSACGFSANCGTKGLHAHHPRDCLYHLRDWSVSRLHLLLQYYRVSPSWLKPGGVTPDTSLTGVCLVELNDGSGKEEHCGRATTPEYRGYCQLHYKERLVELINRCRADPVVLFSPGEMVVELQRWNLAVPTRKPEEPEPLYAHRLHLILTKSIPLRRHSPLKLHDDFWPLTSAVAVGTLPPPVLLSDSTLS
ncbi:hypothetical protein PAMP_005427 [Pampus punctatissimus]